MEIQKTSNGKMILRKKKKPEDMTMTHKKTDIWVNGTG